MRASLTAVSWFSIAVVALSAPGCTGRAALPAARSIGDVQSGAVMMQVPEATVSNVVGPTAVLDCKRAFDLGWISCATVADRCTQLILRANDQAILIFDPAECDGDLQTGQWLLGSPKADRHSLIPTRGPDEVAPEIMPLPPATPPS